MTELYARLRLLYAFGAGNPALYSFIDPDDISAGYESLMNDGCGYAKAMRALTDDRIESLLGICERNGITVSFPGDSCFPEMLTYIEDVPLLIFAMGDLSRIKDSMAAAVVGCRSPDSYSLNAAAVFARELAGRDVNIVSGFARGIDSAAHRAALEAEGVTTAVLGCGLLFDYPRGSNALKRDIAARGAVISEYLPEQTPSRYSFKYRNRLISGLSHCTVVIEASGHSGSLNTAGHAAVQGRDVFVLPPRDIFSKRYAGQCALLEDGAQLALSPAGVYERIVESYGFLHEDLPFL